MDQKLLLTVLFCCWTTAASRYVWTNKPWLTVSDHEINDGDSLNVSCTVPIDFLGGDCRLHRRGSLRPFAVMAASSYVCLFTLTSQELLGAEEAGSQVAIRCDYTLQSYTSTYSDTQRVTVYGRSPSPVLTVGGHVVSPEGSVEVTCSPPSSYSASSCDFYRDDRVHIRSGSCSRNFTGQELRMWDRPALMVPVNMSCTYDPSPHRFIRSDLSTHLEVYVVDLSFVSSSVDCKVSVGDKQLEDVIWTSVGTNGSNITVHVTHGNLTPNETCSLTETQGRQGQNERPEEETS